MNCYKALYIIFMIVCATIARAQSPIRVQIQVTKPYPNKISDFQSNPAQVVILLTNNSQTTYNVQLLGSVNGDNNVSVRTSNNYRSGRPIVVPPLALTRVSAEDISALFNPNTLVFAGITKEEATRMNGLPEGIYQICVKAVDYTTRAPLSEDEPLGCSNIFMVSNLEPPVIIKPFQDDSLTARSPQNLVFSWSLSPGAPPSTQYTVRLVELPDMNRNPFDVMRSSRQPYFETVVIGAPTILYGPSEPPLVEGKRYALMVTASDPFGNVVFRNGGRSEVIAFTYGRPERRTGTTFRDAAGRSTFPNLPRTVISGKINWYYRASEEKAPSLTSIIAVPYHSDSKLKEAILDPSSGPESTSVFQKALKETNASLSILSPAPPNQAIVSSPVSAAKKTSSVGMIISGGKPFSSVATADLNVSGNYSNYFPNISKRGNNPYPLKRVTVKLYAVDTAGKESLIGTTTTDDEGSFEVAFINVAFYNPALGRKIRVAVDHPDFVLQDAVHGLSKPDSSARIDLGTLWALARTYRFQPTVLDESKVEFRDAIVEIYRPVSYHDKDANMKMEGSIKDNTVVTINGQSCVKVAAVPSGGNAVRLFYSDNFMDYYKVRVVHKSLKPLTETLSISAFGGVKEEVSVIRQTYNCVTRMPGLKGTVVKRLNPEINVPGAIVTLYFNDDADYGPKNNSTIEGIGKQYYDQAGVKVSAVSLISNTPSVTKVSTTSHLGSAKSVVGNLNLLAPATTSPQSGGPYASTFVGGSATSVSAAAVLSHTRSTTTDSLGNFLFNDLPISPKETRMTVRIPGIEKVFEFKVLISTKGMEYDLGKVYIDMTVFTIGGVVKNEEGEPISRPVVRWVSGGSPREGDEYGRFVIENTAGKDTLVVSKLGFQEKRIPITLTEPVAPEKKSLKADNGTSLKYEALSPSMWSQQVVSLPSLATQGPAAPFSASGLGFHTVHTVNRPILNLTVASTPKETGNNKTGSALSLAKNNVVLDPLYTALITPEQLPVPPIDLGTIVLRKKIGRLLVKVTRDSDSSNVSNATINILDTSITGTTDGNGRWFSEVPGGTVVVEVTAPAGSGLVAVQKQVVTSDTDTTLVPIPMKNGVTVSGTVRAGAANISDANIRVDGLDYIKTKTNSTGAYTIIIPTGDYTLKATKTGYIGAERQQVFSGTTAEVNFNLTQAGFDITKILGFEVEIEKMEGSGNTRSLSGAIINVPSNSMFTAKPNERLPFDNVVVNLAGNVPVPQGGQLALSVTHLDVLAFGYLPVRVKNNDLPLVIKQIAGNNSAGRLEGIPEINYQKFIPIPIGLKVPDGIKHRLTTASPSAVAILSAGESLPAIDKFSIQASGGNVDLYGFTVELNSSASEVKSDALYFKGNLNLSGVPLLNNSKLSINELVIGKDATIKKVNIDVGENKSISLASWSASLLSVGINENGLKLSGNVKVKIPESAESGIGFDNLTISKTALYGGDFTLPEEGIDVFRIVKMKRGIKPLSFGRLGNTPVHYIGGSGEFKLPKFIDKTLSVEFFQIQTDGKFEARVPVNMNVPLLGLADISIRSLGFRTTGGVGIDVMGNFNLHAIPFFKASAGGIHYGRNGAISVDELGVGFDLVGIASLNARAKFVDQPERKGFEGSGNIKIKATPLDLGLGFRYYKLPAGIEIGALLRAGVVIPIGVVTLAEIEGEFGLNTQDKKWMGRIGGSLSIGALNAALAIKPLSITVENGPVFKLDGGLAVLGQSIAKAQGILDFPKSYFSFDFKQDLNFLPELYTTQGGGRFVVSTAKDNTYWMMGVMYQASMLGGLVKGNANITAGWGLNVDAHPEHFEYTNFINREYLDNNVLKGIHVATFAGINFDTGERSFAEVASGRAWYNNYGAVNMDMGFGRGRYGFRVAAGWEAGAYLKIADMNVAGAEVGVDGELSGFYDYGARFLKFDGSLRAKLIAWIGDCSNSCMNKICWGGCFDPCSFLTDCEICPIPVGGKICLKPGINASFSSASGFSMGIDF